MAGVFQRCIIMVADGGRADLMTDLLRTSQLPNIKRHIVDRGCFRTALSVFPSTTGPAHIPFVSGVHPGTANMPGYRWLCRRTHDERRRSMFRHGSLNSPRGMFASRDCHPDCTSLFEHFERPSSVLELIDLCNTRPLYKVRVRRLLRIMQAHRTGNWDRVDQMVERLVIKRIDADSDCIVASFFCIDEYSHLYDPFAERTVNAYRNFDRSVGNIVAHLKRRNVYDETILAVVSDHGLSATRVHLPVVDIVREHGFTPHFYPRLYRRRCDAAVMESGNAMCQLYFKRGDRWGQHWHYDEMCADERIGRLMQTLTNTEGMSFLIARNGENGVLFRTADGSLTATPDNGCYRVEVTGINPLPEHPIGRFTARELRDTTYDHAYPDAVNQAFLLFRSARSGDVILSSDPGYDLRLQYEDPEHKSSHGSLHRDHMHVPLAMSVPFDNDKVHNYDIVPTILKLCGKDFNGTFDGTVLDVPQDSVRESEAAAPRAPTEAAPGSDARNHSLASILLTVAIIVIGIIIVGLFQDDLTAIGTTLIEKYGQQRLDIVLLLVTAVSSSPLALPIWGYALIGIAMGYSIWRLALVMAIGSALGSWATYGLGRYSGRHPWVRRWFPNVEKHPWTTGKSLTMVTWILFIGTASPLPLDVMYVACGAKRYPVFLFPIVMVGARFVRYAYLGVIFKYFPDLFG